MPSYFATQIEFKPGVIGVAILLTGFSVLLCLFGPRVIIAIKSLNSTEKEINRQVLKVALKA